MKKRDSLFQNKSSLKSWVKTTFKKEQRITDGKLEAMVGKINQIVKANKDNLKKLIKEHAAELKDLKRDHLAKAKLFE